MARSLRNSVNLHIGPVPSLLRLALRLFHTVRHLTPTQAVYLLRSRLAHPRAVRLAAIPPARHWNTRWAAPRWRPAARLSDGVFSFLGRSARVEIDSDWDAPEQSRLWRYNLHYLDDLEALAASLSDEDRCALLDQWIEQNPPGRGTGWEPYPLSLRIINTIKFIGRSAADRVQWRQSLALQVRALEQRIEYHIRANHLFENGKALVFAGSFFDGPTAHAWLRKGLGIIDAECREQFLLDGGHFELSPMYHGTMLWNVCDLIHLADSSGVPELIERTPVWRALLRNGLDWYAAMTHPEGGIAFFNDAALGVAPDLSTVLRYAAFLGVAADVRTSHGPLLSLLHLNASGYLRVDLDERSTAIMDVARVGPDYQPGHAHADTLSFELSLFGQRVFVNSGTSTYEPGAERDAQRGTASHNTVIIDGCNSSDTWAGFRVGRRAMPQLIDTESSDDRVMIRASHDGYRRLAGGATHFRQWTWTSGGVSVLDRIDGSFRRAVANYHLHPGVQGRSIDRDRGLVQLTLADGRTVSVRVLGGRLSLLPSFWYPGFGRSIANQRLSVEFTGPSLETHISWLGPA